MCSGAKGRVKLGHPVPDLNLSVELNSGSLDSLMRRLRDFVPALIGRAQNDRLRINLRSVSEADEALLGQILIAALKAETTDG